MTSEEDKLYMAKLAEQAERYEEMVVYMREVAASKESLTLEERNLLSVAYKNVVGARRASLRVFSSIAGRDAEASGPSWRSESLTAYRVRVEEELDTICSEILQILEERLMPGAQDGSSSQVESQVFYQKMHADYYRYLSEFKSGEERAEITQKADSSYQAAQQIAHRSLSPTHPIRLGLALNYSVFLYEVVASGTKACELAKQAFDDAIAELDTLDEESYKDSTLIMQLLRDNLTLWKSDECVDDS